MELAWLEGISLGLFIGDWRVVMMERPIDDYLINKRTMQTLCLFSKPRGKTRRHLRCKALLRISLAIYNVVYLLKCLFRRLAVAFSLCKAK